MSAGGATPETAGLLTLGSNTFDLASGTGELKPGWWKFAVDAYEYITLERSAVFADGADPVAVGMAIFVGNSGPDTFLTGGIAFPFQASPRLTYWVRVEVAAPEYVDDVVSVGVTRGLDPAERTYTDWSTQLKDMENRLHISCPVDGPPDNTRFTGELMDLNAPAFTPNTPYVVDTGDWYHTVIEADGVAGHLGPPVRFADYTAQQVAAGDDPGLGTGPDCVWGHTGIGGGGFQYWNGDPDNNGFWTGSASCRILPTLYSPADVGGPGALPSYSFDKTSGSFGSKILSGEERKVARGAWFLPVRDNLPPWGVLGSPPSLIDYAAAGVPDDYTGTVYIEFEDQYADLEQIDAAADRQDRSETDDFDTTFHLNVDTEILPTYSDGAWVNHWSIGRLGVELIPPPPTRKMRFSSDGSGTVSWNWISAITDWDDCRSWPDDDPDVILGMELDYGDIPVVDTSAAGHADIAFRFTLHAPRFRLVWYPDEDPVTRQLSRGPDSRGLSSGTRIFPAPQSGRLIGGQQ